LNDWSMHADRINTGQPTPRPEGINAGRSSVFVLPMRAAAAPSGVSDRKAEVAIE
jgi:hypothetical protein